MARNYCFTSFNLKECEELKNSEFTKYITWGEELCPETRKLHYQGYLELSKVFKINALKKLGAETTHFEIRKGSQDQAIKYCHKDGKFIEHGEKKRQGKRNDIISLQKDIKAGKTLKDIADNHLSLFLKYGNGIQKYINMNTIKRSWKTELYIFWGKPGSGKSHKAREMDPNAYWLPEQNGMSLWFDGYNGEETVIIDDFEDEIKYKTLLRLTDEYPLKVQTKGGMVEFLAKKVIITSNTHWKNWFPNRTDDEQALARRITQCTEIKAIKPTKIL